MSTRASEFIPVNDRGSKPRTRGLTEIRGPYYTAVGPRYLEAGAAIIMIESEGITESVLGTEALMFEAADPAVTCEAITSGLFRRAIDNSPDCKPRYAVYAVSAVNQPARRKLGL
jgi:hypothetical protein